MQILFAAPFILAAGIAFAVLSVWPSARHWALPVPTGIIGACPSSLLGLFASVLVTQFLESGRTGRGWLVGFICMGALTGLVGGVLIAAFSRVTASLLPSLLLRSAVFIAAWCSYFVLLAGLLFFLPARAYDHAEWPVVAATVSLEAAFSFIGAWLMAQRSEKFRPRQFGLPQGTSFHDRCDSGQMDDATRGDWRERMDGGL